MIHGIIYDVVAVEDGEAFTVEFFDDQGDTAGVQPVVLKTWLGHTNIHMTLDIYSDVFDKMDFGALEKFDTLIETII